MILPKSRDKCRVETARAERPPQKAFAPKILFPAKKWLFSGRAKGASANFTPPGT